MFVHLRQLSTTFTRDLVRTGFPTTATRRCEASESCSPAGLSGDSPVSAISNVMAFLDLFQGPQQHADHAKAVRLALKLPDQDVDTLAKEIKDEFIGN